MCSSDLDDAVWAMPDDDPKNEGGFRAIVAIADVSFYVRPGSALDRDARRRGNSVYFPDRVVPMLPEILSADVCSLKSGEDRAALVCHLTIDAKGALKDFRFLEAEQIYRSVLRDHPLHARAQTNLAISLSGSGRTAEAVALLEQASERLALAPA